MIRVAIAAVVAALFVVSIPPAEAQREPMKPAVKKQFDRALKAFSRKDYKEAAAGFAEVYEQVQRIDVLFAWAQSTRLSGDCARALKLYRELEREAALGDRDRVAVEKGIRKCGAEPLSAQPADPLDGDGNDGATTTDTTSDQPTSTTRVTAGVDRPWYTDGLGDALLAAGVVTTGFAVGLFAVSASDADAADGAQTEAEHIRFEDRARSRRTFAVITTGVGVALIGGAVFRYLTRDSGSDGALAVWGTGDGFGVALGGGF